MLEISTEGHPIRSQDLTKIALGVYKAPAEEVCDNCSGKGVCHGSGKPIKE